MSLAIRSKKVEEGLLDFARSTASESDISQRAENRQLFPKAPLAMRDLQMQLRLHIGIMWDQAPLLPLFPCTTVTYRRVYREPSPNN
jgi:hypothetical protein